MEVIYFHKQPKLNGYYFKRRTNFEYGVQLWFDESNYDEAYDNFLLPIVHFLVENYGLDIHQTRYEFCQNESDTMYRIYFKDETDQTACKIMFPGEWDPDPNFDEDGS